MPKYGIEVVDGKLTILNESNEPITPEAAQLLISELMASYPGPGSVYVLMKSEANRTIYKIGFTGQELSARLRQIRFDEGDPTITILHVIKCSSVVEARILERWLHELFKFENVRGEWFRLEYHQIQWLCAHTVPPVKLNTEDAVLSGDFSSLFTYLHSMAVREGRAEVASSIETLLSLTTQEINPNNAEAYFALISPSKQFAMEIVARALRGIASSAGLDWNPEKE